MFVVNGRSRCQFDNESERSDGTETLKLLLKWGEGFNMRNKWNCRIVSCAYSGHFQLVFFSPGPRQSL